MRGIEIFDAKILHSQAADGRDHPAILFAMIVDAADLADIPADGENFKELAFVDQISGVMAIGVKKVGSQGLRLNGFALGEFEHAGNGEFFFRNGAELFHPFINGDEFHRLFIFRRRRGAHGRASWWVWVQISNASLYRCGGAVAAENRRAAACYHDRKMPANQSHVPVNLLGQSAEELRALMQALGEPAYRGAQIYHALYAERRFDVASMSNLPVALRERLAREACIALPQVVRRHLSGDGTVRYVLALAATDASGEREGCEARDGGNGFHAGRKSPDDLHFDAGRVRRGLPFLPDGDAGADTESDGGRNCRASADRAGRKSRSLKPQTNVVLMGQGEPLLNYEPVMAALRILLDPNGVAITPKHTTLSTSGIIPGIERLGGEKVRPKLAISLNASSNEQRDKIMPINRKYPIEDLLAACARYPLRPWEHLTFEYVLLGGFNDAPEDARRVAKLLANLRAKVNLIPWNPGELPYKKPDEARTEEFRHILEEKGVRAFVRYSRGQDVMAACGQLALLESAALPGAASSLSRFLLRGSPVISRSFFGSGDEYRSRPSGGLWCVRGDS